MCYSVQTWVIRGELKSYSTLPNQFCENSSSCSPRDLGWPHQPRHTKGMKNALLQAAHMVPIQSGGHPVREIRAGCRSRKNYLISVRGVAALQFMEKWKPCDGVFEGWPLADCSIQWGAIWFVPISALHRWVVVQISLSFPRSAFPSRECLAGQGLIWQSPS